MRKIVLLGDSIRMFYLPDVRQKLGEDYHITSPEENCRFSMYTLNSLRFWLPYCPHPDVIHWNNGLWDIKRLYEEDGNFEKVEKYVENMKKILRELQKTGAKVIFATTTPVSNRLEGISNEDIVRYNQAILEAFKEEDVIINDLHTVAVPDIEQYISEDLIHPSEYGIEILSDAVVRAIKAQDNWMNPIQDEVVIPVVKVRDEKTLQ